ncbi:ATP-binding cassette domain-containing protein [Oceanirhabdus sp. W0125-5]|uniref:ATP-binding cassette domain-containing protein n=1 Tax=Oceanirhabdus sp. W0125-5 TaxID=2999116 RepID=UPI0022F2B100|nr:ABC transporter ATP-binding protein [Oceanirhabdus sp. W0125-5]WBW94722.1 ABC transporter ATP-binding protein [Oceanirhabdus sp. W0125-5]
MIKSLTYTSKLFYSEDKRNVILYYITVILTVPLFLGELILTREVIDTIQNATSTFSYKETLYLIIFLVVVIYINTLNASIKALTSTSLIEIGLYKKEKLILEKSSKLSLTYLEWPKIKALRERAKGLPLFELFEQWMNSIIDFITIGALLIILIHYECSLVSLIVLTGLLLQLLINKKIVKNKEIIYKKQSSSRLILDYLFNLLVQRETIQEIKTYNMCPYLKKKWKRIFKMNFKELQKKVIAGELISILQNIVIAIMNGVCIIILVIISSKSGNGAGVFVMLLKVVSQLFILLPRFSASYSSLKSSSLRFKEFNEFLNLQEEIREQGTLPECEKGMKVVIKELSFKYKDSKKDNLRGIDMVINPGEKVALVGENGSGKSTLVKIILGLYTPKNGYIDWSIRGESIKEKEVVNGSRVVFQDYTRLLRPIRENIAIGDIKHLNDDNKLNKAINKAECNEYVKSLDEQIGPEFGGRDFSGGQWQRLAISRAYLNEKQLTIFDEPTASLDPKAELKAFEAFVNLSDNKTSIIVTHRLYMAKAVDRIFVLEDGQIVESGTHSELMKLQGKYEKMYISQSDLHG